MMAGIQNRHFQQCRKLRPLRRRRERHGHASGRGQSNVAFDSPALGYD
jgi:hypothetical protein